MRINPFRQAEAIILGDTMMPYHHHVHGRFPSRRPIPGPSPYKVLRLVWLS